MKSIATIAKSIMTGVLTLGTLYAYGKELSFDKKQTDFGKNSQKNNSPVIFVSEGTFIFNEEKNHNQKVLSSPVESFEVKSSDILFISEGTIVYNAQDIVVYHKNDENIPPVKTLAENTKPYNKPLQAKENSYAKQKPLAFLGADISNQFVSLSDKRCYSISAHHNYQKQLTNDDWRNSSLYVSLNKLQSEYTTDVISYYQIKKLSIRPPPFRYYFTELRDRT